MTTLKRSLGTLLGMTILVACSPQGQGNAGPKTVISPQAQAQATPAAGTAANTNATAAPVHHGKASIAHANIAKGKQVFEGTCFACHATGVAGAPKLGDKRAWAHHLAKGDKVLLAHAENGFTGHTGTMPARGGNPSLTNQDIADAIAYMKSKVK
ncbi:MAG: c-type cytochrome [Acidiferrobacteraceae bacterium]